MARSRQVPFSPPAQLETGQHSYLSTTPLSPLSPRCARGCISNNSTCRHRSSRAGGSAALATCRQGRMERSAQAAWGGFRFPPLPERLKLVDLSTFRAPEAAAIDSRAPTPSAPAGRLSGPLRPLEGHMEGLEGSAGPGSHPPDYSAHPAGSLSCILIQPL